MNRWQQLVDRYAALQQREQLLIAAMVLAIGLVLCDWLLWAPQRAQAARIEQQLADTRTQLSALTSQQQDTQQKLAADPDAALRAQIDAVRVHIEMQDAELAKLMVDLIPPDAMASVLRDLLVKRKQLKLVALANTPAQPAFIESITAPANTAATPQTDDESPVPTIYRHGLSLTFRGSYFDVVDYLHALVAEDSAASQDASRGGKRRFFWESIDYQVDKYPEAEVTLKVYTLGNKEAWIGA